jgi:hypothetical protein
VTIQMKKLAAITLASAVIAAACSTEVPSTAPLRTFFNAVLNGASEVPPVTTTSTGSSNITVIDTNIVRVQTFVTAIDSVTQAHIHAGSTTVAGPIMVFLLGPFSATQLVARGPGGSAIGLDGVLSHVDIIRGQTVFSGAFTFDSLLYRINNGTAYVNVHTRRNPGGEIRGQITP